MPEYSVTIKLSGHDPKNIVRNLERAFGSTVAQQARIIGWGQRNYYDDPCQSSGHFGCVHWTTDDVESRFRTLDVPFTPDRLKEVKNNLNHIDDGMTELGWEVIEQAIKESAGRLKW
jgi:hypothetical protein